MSEKFEEAIVDYFSKRPKLEYLNLEIPDSSIGTVQNIEYLCFKSGFKHKYHSEDPQLNLLLDFQLATLANSKTTFDRLNLLSKVSLKHFHCLSEKLVLLENRQKEFELTLETFKQKLHKIPTKVDLAEQISLIFDHPKQIEQKAIQLSEQLDQKIDRVEKLCQALLHHLV